MKIKQYKIVSSRDAEQVAQIANSLMAEGWELKDDLKVTASPNAYGGTDIYYTQVLTR